MDIRNTRKRMAREKNIQENYPCIIFTRKFLRRVVNCHRDIALTRPKRIKKPYPSSSSVFPTATPEMRSYDSGCRFLGASGRRFSRVQVCTLAPDDGSNAWKTVCTRARWCVVCGESPEKAKNTFRINCRAGIPRRCAEQNAATLRARRKHGGASVWPGWYTPEWNTEEEKQKEGGGGGCRRGWSIS